MTVQQDEESQHYQTAILPMRSKAGIIPGAVLVLRDITRLKELDRLKSEFVMTASHELRTPLTSIGMSVSLLMESAAAKLTDQERELLDVCHEEVNRLKALVNDLLDLSKIEAGKLELSLEPVAPGFLSLQASTMIKTQADAKGIALTVEVPEDLPEVLADSNKIVWVLVNLLANAVRYTRLAAMSGSGGNKWEIWSILKCRMTVPACPGKCNPVSLINLSGWIRGRPAAAAVWAWPSAKRSSGPTGASSGWSQSPARAAPSPSPCPWPHVEEEIR